MDDVTCSGLEQCPSCSSALKTDNVCPCSAGHQLTGHSAEGKTEAVAASAPGTCSGSLHSLGIGRGHPEELCCQDIVLFTSVGL